jgi:hypothetical protein
MIAITITPNTTIFTISQDHYLDGILGNQSAGQWVRSARQNGETIDGEACRVSSWLEEMTARREGYYLSREEAQSVVDQAFCEGEIVEFTAKDAVTEIHRIADEE